MFTEYYRIWYRDDSGPDIDEIPDKPEYRRFTLEELISATQDLTVTHMSISEDIPPELSQIAPHLKALKIRDITYHYQLKK